MRKDLRNKKNMQPLVAVDLSSSGVRAMAAKKNTDGTLSILGVETAKRTKAFDKGNITNSSTVGGDILATLRLLRNRIQMSSEENIEYAFTSIGGYKLQSTHVSVKRDQITHTHVTEQRIKEMEQECRSKIENKYPELKVLAVEPIYYQLDETEQDYAPTPNQKTRFITIVYDVFVGLKSAYDNIVGAFQRANAGIEAQFAQPNALLTALCNEQDLKNGVAIIDFGHQTTTLVIYKGDAFRTTYVVPMGGYHITRDIQDVQITEEYAETVKVRFGSASEKAVTRNQVIGIPSLTNPAQKVELSTTFLAHIIEARLTEIMELIMQRVRAFQGTDTLTKIYLTGGGAMMQNIVPFVQQFTNVPVEYGSHADWLEANADDAFYEPQYAELIGTLILGAEYRETHQDVVPAKGPFKWKGWLETVQQTTLEIFTDNQ